MRTEKLKLILSRLMQKTSILIKDLSFFVKQCLGKKKVVVISEKGISSLPVSFRLQASFSVFVLFFMLWVSYSTGKYFAYENIVSQKDKVIWETNNKNDKLQYEVSDLHDNLIELNKYFDNIRKFDQLAEKKIFNGKGSNGVKVSSLGHRDKILADDSENVQGILSNIREKVLERIGSLESIIEMTGLKVEEVAARNEKLRRILMKSQDHGVSHQGGAFIPYDEGSMFDHESFDNEVSYLMQLEKIIHSFPLASPMNRYWISSGYGKRIDPIKRKPAMHAGLDLVGRFKSKVYSSAPGVIKSAKLNGAYGRFIEVNHGSGVTTRYGHLAKILVKVGDKVERGQLIALQGNSGRSTGTHLHYEVRYNNKPYDPRKFLTAGKYVF